MENFKRDQYQDYENINYFNTEPDSHFWINIEMLLNWLEYQPNSKMKIELIKGLKNTLNNGYNIIYVKDKDKKY